MRIRNGAAYLEATIRSHMPHFDEIVALYNQCTDATPDILARLGQEFGPKLRVIHYLDRVYPGGSRGHRSTPASSPNSMVNYYNTALAATRFSIVTKLDDDHLAIEKPMAEVVAEMRRGNGIGKLVCFSGLNLFRGPEGAIGILRQEPVSGQGDIGFFNVTEQTYFTHDRRFERFRAPGLRRVHAGFTYWHLKFLKPDMGFANYELADNPKSRYGRKLARLAGAKPADLPVIVDDWSATYPPNRWIELISWKYRLRAEIGRSLRAGAPHQSLEDALANLATFSKSD